MLPNDVLSSTPVVADYLSPDNRTRELLVDYEMGGVALYNTSVGVAYQVWTLTYVGEDVIATPDVGSPVTLFTLADITECSLAFDQNMNPFVAYVVGGAAWIWWYDSDVASQVHTQLDAGVTNPRCTLDDKRDSQTASSDIILAYLRVGNLYFRQQRDRYTVEYLLATGATGSLIRIGMGSNLRLHFGLTSSTLEAVPAPGAEGQDEIVAPFWESTGNWIDLSQLDQVTFENQFGYPVDQVGHTGVYDLGEASTVAISVNASAGTYRIRLDDDSGYTNGSMHITDASGNVVSSMIYSGTPTGESLTIPTGAHFIVISTDTNSFATQDWDTYTVDITGSVPWTSIFDGYDFGEVISYRVAERIPAEGLSIRFTVPEVTSFAASFMAFEYAGMNSACLLSISETVGDYVGLDNDKFYAYNGGVSGGYPVYGGVTLSPGRTYFWNIKWEDGRPNTIYLSQTYVSPIP